MVFINCPFDDEYEPLFKALTFAFVYCGYKPIAAKTDDDSSGTPIQKIKSMIQRCDFTVHDLSRCQSSSRGELARFNMPFELGLAVGLKEYGGRAFAHKRMLVLDAKKHRYDAVISDLSGYDIKIHNNEEKRIVCVIRDWLSSLRTDKLPAGEKIMEEFRSFISDGLLEIARESGYTKRNLKRMPYHEFVEIAKTWIAGKKREREHIRL